ncbi:hypothetical protein P171DRAFT_515305 [Karstenula rhodostoma CBS 690.94]|uniref:Uncharacterized protein n=1 Tax=Karstenula rhodostoma CBS 690.94 TaxID=1392251 RepID=A0A9P4PTU8_9PLEO|nr:hypothetical protein P171DRAFT_515305 [Karstenula rhodostoma CBS 690.94]
MSGNLEMAEQEEFAVALHDRLTLTQVDDLVGLKRHAVTVLRTEATSRLTYQIPPDESSCVPTAPLLSYRNVAQLEADLSARLYNVWLKVAVWLPVHLLMAVHGPLLWITGVCDELALPSLLRRAIGLHTYRLTLLLTVGGNGLCTAATAVHWLESLSGSLRTVCTTVTLRAVRTTAVFYLRKVAKSCVLSIERALKRPAPASTSLLHDITTSLGAPSADAHSLRGPPPLPPITTPPDEDFVEPSQDLEVQSYSISEPESPSAERQASAQISTAPPLPPITTPPDSDTALRNRCHNDFDTRSHPGRYTKQLSSATFAGRAIISFGRRVSVMDRLIRLLCSSSWVSN